MSRKPFVRPAHWRRYAVSYGNGNDGLSRLFPAFFVWADPDRIWDVARVAMMTRGDASRRWLKANTHVDEAGPDAMQACIYDPPKSPGWSDHNGAWRLCEVYPADEASDNSEAPEYASPSKAFGRSWPFGVMGA